MKNIILLFVILFNSVAYSQTWKTNFEEAKKEATEQNKKILLVFSGSDWCAPCIKLDKNVWQSEEFKTFAGENLILEKADFPKKKGNTLPTEIKTGNSALAEQYNKEGFFPLVIVLDNTGKVISKKGYENQTASEYVAMLKSLIK